ncbi:hypothetical protein BVC80_1837g180 [Macleaya cordata]|uniref:Centromere protein S n=1 Tax=Macleaya cordata TaxID=56857 RepID=A0A200R3V6_MACCD|nr:hypothetical protein BVC80_1837g180 [Macleaya cordata]
MDERGESDYERDEDESTSNLLRDRFRLSAISIAEAEAKKNDMEISQPVMACIADLAFKFTEQLAKDLELFAQHAGRKSVNMEDVILSAHRNEHMASSLRSFSHELKGKEPQSERKRKKASKKEDKATSGVINSTHLSSANQVSSSTQLTSARPPQLSKSGKLISSTHVSLATSAQQIREAHQLSLPAQLTW